MWLERYRLSEHNIIVEAQQLAYKMRTLLARMNLRLLVAKVIDVVRMRRLG